MKANGLKGDYCQTCAAILDDVQRHHRRVVVLDSQCAAVFHQSGDAALLDEIQKGDRKITEHAMHVAPALPLYEEKKESEALKETVHTKAGKTKARRGAH